MPSDGPDERLRRDSLAATDLLSRSGVMSPTGHVNLSTRIDATQMLMSARGIAHELTADDFASVHLDGEPLEGSLDASVGEIVGMHAVVYRTRAEAGCVVHTHSPRLTAFAIANQPLPCRYEALLRRGQAQAVPVAPWAPRGSEGAVQGIADTLTAHPGTMAVLLANHGVLAFAESPLAAAKLIIVLEEAASAEIAAIALGGGSDLPAAGNRPDMNEASAGNSPKR